MSDFEGGCPHLTMDDRRCAHRFRLNQLDQLFEVCCDRFHSCSIYHHLTLEQGRPESGTSGAMRATPAATRLTINGFTHNVRATGS